MIKTRKAQPELFATMARLARKGVRLKSKAAGGFIVKPLALQGASYSCGTLAEAEHCGKCLAATLKATARASGGKE